MSVQKSNDDKKLLNRTHFQGRYEPNFAVANMVSIIFMLPGITAYYPTSSYTPTILGDTAGNNLTLQNTPTFGSDVLAPYIELNGVNQYANAATIEVFERTTKISLGCWVWFDTLTGTQGIISKWHTTGNERSYLLELTGGIVRGSFSFDGSTSGLILTASASALIANEWNNIVLTGKAVGSNFVGNLYVNGRLVDNDTAIGSTTLFNSAADFQIGSSSGAANFLNGKLSNLFLCRDTIELHHVHTLFGMTKAMYNKRR